MLPDITFLLTLEGVIQETTLSSALASEAVQGWIGRPWAETVDDLGGEKVRRMIEDAKASHVAVLGQVTQRFPSGVELLMEYTTVQVGGGGLMAIGKSMQAVAELQGRLIAAQQAIERDYWKLREVETRYRLLFDASNEAVMLVGASDLRIIEANPAAVKALGLAKRRPAVAGRELLPEMLPEERETVQAMLRQVREHGKAPGVVAHLGDERQPWLLRASLMAADPGPLFLLQLAPGGSQARIAERATIVPLEDLIERAPDGFAVIDEHGVVQRANRAFAEMVQVASPEVAVGQRVARWLGRPGADLTVLLANVQRYGAVRLFATTIHGELDADTEVEISAVGAAPNGTARYGLLVRDVGRRLPSPAAGGGRIGSLVAALSDQIGKTSLRALVKETVAGVERHYVEKALELTGGNRTAAAELLGLSRQSLYAKLDRYGLADGGREQKPTPPAS
ncbi:MAG TPA: transcriptional regulator PpsR [Pelomicrobium sp.]|nr:transcriptional regulator PpsR [Pelomicrobium sp.]